MVYNIFLKLIYRKSKLHPCKVTLKGNSTILTIKDKMQKLDYNNIKKKHDMLIPPNTQRINIHIYLLK